MSNQWLPNPGDKIKYAYPFVVDKKTRKLTGSAPTPNDEVYPAGTIMLLGNKIGENYHATLENGKIVRLESSLFQNTLPYFGDERDYLMEDKDEHILLEYAAKKITNYLSSILPNDLRVSIAKSDYKTRLMNGKYWILPNTRVDIDIEIICDCSTPSVDSVYPVKELKKKVQGKKEFFDIYAGYTGWNPAGPNQSYYEVKAIFKLTADLMKTLGGEILDNRLSALDKSLNSDGDISDDFYNESLVRLVRMWIL